MGLPTTTMDDEKTERQWHSGDPEKGGLHDEGNELPYDEDEEEGEQGMKSAVDGGPEKKGMPWRRYGSVNPFRWRQPPPVPKRRSVSKEGSASWISLITFSWIGGLMKTGYLRPLETNDIPLVAPDRETRVITANLQASFKRRQERGDKYPLLFALNEVFFWEFWFAGACRMVADILLIINPFLLRYLIRFAVESFNASREHGPHPDVGRGVGLAVGISLIQMVASICVSQFVYHAMMVGGMARAGLIGMVFDKSLKISGRAKAGGDAAMAFTMATALQRGETDRKGRQTKKRKKGKTGEQEVGWSNGKVVNLMATDTYCVDRAAAWCHMCWTSPVQVLVTLALLLVNLSYSALAGFGLFIVGMPILSWVIRVLANKRKSVNKITDKRVALTQEILMSVRFVKYFGWEESFLSRLQDLRKKEIRAVQFLIGIKSGVTAVGLSLPVFASMLAFVTFSLTNNNLDPASVFSSLSLFNTFRLPLNLLPTIIAQTIDAWVSIQRLQEYFLAEEIIDRVAYDANLEAAIRVENGDFTWERNTLGDENEDVKLSKKLKKLEVTKTDTSPVATPQTGDETPLEPFRLESINLSVGQHELLAVVGSVGCGKTSLLAALAGDMRRTAGKVTMCSRLAYCPQYAWIQNANVRENIVFGKEFDPAWYEAVVEACALQADLDILPDGDMTEIGERGITISGGQKQRLNIARAIYFDAQIVLLDDPLSAVDAHVGKHLFDNAICGLLKDKCRVLATHQLHVLEKVDRVVWMEEGRIQAAGTYDELTRSNPAFAEMMKEISTEKKEKKEEEASGESAEIVEDEKKDTKVPVSGRVLMQDEERAEKSVGWNVYGAYIKASGTILVAPALLLMLSLSQAGNIITTLWLSYWTSDKYHLTREVYIGVFVGLGIAQSILMFGFAFTLTLAGTKSSRVLMQRAMQRTLRAPMSFFDTTPVGRIVNRFSKDVDVMDNQLTDAIRMYFFTLAIACSVFILIIVYFHYFAIALFPLAVLFLFAASYYRASAREVKRHEAVLRSHVFAKFGESLSGVASIRAYGLEDRFTKVVETALDEMNGAYFVTFANQRWLSTRLDVIGNLLVFTTAILVVTSRFSISPSIAGVVLSYVLQIVMMLQWMIRQLAEVENSMNSTERIHYYGTSLPEEAPAHTNTQLPPQWPESGALRLKDVCMRYRPELPLVLKDLNLDIPAGTRVAVVGRTGAGKSSIASVLFRLVELASGSIILDGVDISTIGLQRLRRSLSIIPQDPTLFKGTIRSNLDPFGEYMDMALYEALRASHLDRALTLDSPVEEEGTNFSLGQRQQVALARALVRGSKVVVADEATSSVDVETDRLIQQSMKQGFGGGTTVICIAHRLRTVVEYDVVVVMGEGKVLEMASPRELWGREGSVFRGMCERSGITHSDIPR